MDTNQGRIDTDQLASLHGDAWRWTLHLVQQDRSFAEDVLQTAYLSILDGKAKWHGKSSLKTWVFGVIRITARAMHRKRALRSFRFPSASAERLATLSPAISGHTPMTRSMQAALRNLPPKQAELAELVFGQDFTIEEAANIMRISLGTARTHYARAKTRLRQALSHLHEDVRDD